MKAFIKIILCSILISSCGGNDDSPIVPSTPQELGEFDLTFPDNNLICTEGQDTYNFDDNVIIDFRWTPAENATSYNLEITNLETNEIIDGSRQSQPDLYFNSVTLPKGTQFSWKVTAYFNDQTKESELWNFYTEGSGQENYAPFPAEITTADQMDGFVEISWEGSDLDNDIEKYDLYFGTDAENLEFISSTTSDEGSSSQPILYGTIYHIEVITTDARGYSSSSKTSIKYQG